MSTTKEKAVILAGRAVIRTAVKYQEVLEE